MRGVSRNRFWLCFRPLGIEARPHETEHVAGRDTVYGYMDHNGGAKLSKTASSLSESDCLAVSDERRRPKRSLSRVLRAVGFQPSLRRSVGDGGRLSKSKSIGYLEVEAKKSNPKPLKLHTEEVAIPKSVLYQTSSSPSSPACDPNPNPNTPTTPEPCFPGPNQNQVNPGRDPIVGARFVGYVFLICLCATVFWGRHCAVFLTATCMFVLPRRRTRGTRRREAESPEKGAGECKRRVLTMGH